MGISDKERILEAVRELEREHDEEARRLRHDASKLDQRGRKALRAGHRTTGASRLATVSGKGQVTIPAELRKKYGIRQGMKVEVLDAPTGLMLRPIPRIEDLAGVDAGKYSYSEMTEKLDRLRQRWR